VKQYACDVGGALNRDAPDRLNDVVLLDASSGGWRVSDNVPGSYSLSRIHPGDTVIWKNKAGALLEIEDREDHGGQGYKCQEDCAEPHSETVIHPATPVTSA